MKNLKSFAIAGLLVVGALALSACNKIPGYGSQSQTPTQTQQNAQTQQTQPANSVEIKNYAFSPATIKVKAGETITITNKDAVGHSFTSDDGTSFDTDIIAKDTTVTVTAPTKPGSYGFHCTPHPNMKGTLVVE